MVASVALLLPPLCQRNAEHSCRNRRRRVSAGTISLGSVATNTWDDARLIGYNDAPQTEALRAEIAR